jgi:predicted RNase H-like nuclease
MRTISITASGTPLPSAGSECWTAGVDGCSGGWVVALACFAGAATQPACAEVRVCAAFAEVLALCPRPRIVAVDMPIGLLARAQPGGRSCDAAARALLGRPRASSVFSPPARAALQNEGYRDAMLRNGGGMSRQAYNILPRIREVDSAMTRALQRRVVEVHPELVFAQLAGRPMQAAKRSRAGQAERLACLRRAWGPALPEVERVRTELGRRRLAVDDILDACVLAHAAQRLRLGHACRLPAQEPPRDARGLRMEIWF